MLLGFLKTIATHFDYKMVAFFFSATNCTNGHE